MGGQEWAKFDQCCLLMPLNCHQLFLNHHSTIENEGIYVIALVELYYYVLLHPDWVYSNYILS